MNAWSTVSPSAPSQRQDDALSSGLDDFRAGVWKPDGRRKNGLYSAEERRRRDMSPWTLVQGILAPIQFLVFVVSLFLVVRYLSTGHGFVAASASIIVKTAFLYAIMITGSLWERDVFGRYLFAPAFYWEDVVSMAVIALHTAYLVCLTVDLFGPVGQMAIALAAYFAYVVNASQFLLKLRSARLEKPREAGGTGMAELAI